MTPVYPKLISLESSVLAVEMCQLYKSYKQFYLMIDAGTYVAMAFIFIRACF